MVVGWVEKAVRSIGLGTRSFRKPGYASRPRVLHDEAGHSIWALDSWALDDRALDYAKTWALDWALDDIAEGLFLRPLYP